MHFIAGLQKYTPAVTACWRRTSTPTAAPTFGESRRNVQWGWKPHLRPAGPLLRTERTPGREPLRRGRCQSVSGSGATLACGYLGMLEKLEPMQEMKASAYDLPYSLPCSLEESLSHLEQCEPIKDMLGRASSAPSWPVKRKEYETYLA